MNGFNFTERVRRVLQRAREESLGLRHEYVGTEHLVLALATGGGVAENALTNLGVDLGKLRQTIFDTVKPGKESGAVSEAPAGLLDTIADTLGLRSPERVDLPYTSRAKKVLELAMHEARDLNHAYVGTEHLLLGVLREERGIGAQVLTSMGVTTQTVRDEVIRLLGTEIPPKTFPDDGPRTAAADSEASITLVVEHSDGRIEAKKFRRSGDAVRFLNGLEY